MKKALLVITICSILVAGGIVTTYMYLHYADCSTYQNGIFVGREVTQFYEAANGLYKGV